VRVLGIETSCDETGVAIYDSEQRLLGHILYSQAELHAEFGGVVPELASRDHIRKLLPLIKEVMTQSQTQTVDAIAYTAGPGLIGALMVGAAVAKSLAMTWNIPALGVHHMEGHLLAPMLEESPPEFPFVALLVSGGHTQLIEVAGIGRYRLLGESLDDAAGEAFDKAAKMLGIGYPGGPRIEEYAKRGRAERFIFPRPMVNRPGLDFSFSGLKTFTRNTIADCDEAGILDDQARADIALAFETAVAETLTIKCRRALEQTGHQTLVIAGGVSANQHLRCALQQMIDKHSDRKLYYPRKEFCTDNGAMIAYTGCQRLMAGQREGFEIICQPRWSMESLPPL